MLNRIQLNTIFQKVILFIIIIIWFLLPLKYGGNINPSDQSTWNVDFISWIIGGWPVFTFPFLGAISLTIVILNRRGLSKKSLIFTFLNIIPGLMVLIASLIGMINTTEKDVAYLFSVQIFSVIVLVSSTIIFMQAYPKTRHFILISICSGFLLSSAYAWNQKYFLFPMVQKQLEKKLDQREQINSKELRILKTTERYGGSFPYSNHLGAHLILVFPLCVLLAWKSGNYIKPNKPSKILITTLTFVFTFKTLWLSGSLASALILLLTIFGLFWFWIQKNDYWKEIFFFTKSRYLFSFILLSVFLVFIFKENIFSEQKLLSLQYRFNVWNSAIQMFKEFPILGVGMGEFYNYHIQNIDSTGEVTRFAHNLFLNLLSQCGFFGGIAALIMLFHPIFIFYLVKKGKLIIQSNLIFIASIAGSLAWSLHSLFNFNIQVPATVATFLILPSLGLKFQKDDGILLTREILPIGIFGIILIGFCLSPIFRIPGEKNYKILEQLIKKGAPKEQIYNTGDRSIEGLLNSPYPPSKIALLSIQLEQYELAVKHLKESIKRTPHRSSYHYWIAYVYAKMGKINEASKSIEQAIFWYPSNKNYIKLAIYINNINK